MKHLVIFFIAYAILLGALSAPSASVKAAEFATLVPPTITSISKATTNDKLFYVGGNTEITGAEIIIYLQNTQDNQVLISTISADEKGAWFYTHPKPLTSGRYLLWTQLKVGNEFSPPGPQNEITVSRTAFQIGFLKLSYEIIYFVLALLLFLIVITLAILNIYHYYQAKGKYTRLIKEIKEAEEAIKQGFATLQNDITQELAVIHQVKLTKSLSREEEAKEEQLLKDLREITQHIKKEVADIGKTA